MMSSRQLIFVALIAAACSGGDDKPARAIAPEMKSVAASPGAPADSISPPVNPCGHTGLWAECSLERRLKQSGFVVKKLDEKPARAGFAIKPVVYSLGASR